MDEVRLANIVMTFEKQKISIDQAQMPMMLGSFPFYVSCKYGESPLDKIIYRDICSKEIKSENILWFEIDPSVYKSPSVQSVVGIDNDGRVQFFNENNIKYKFFKSFDETELAQLFPPITKESYTFTFKCLCGLAAISAITLTIGIASLFLLPPIGIGIGLITAGAVSSLVAGYGLFSQPLVNLETENPNNLSLVS